MNFNILRPDEWLANLEKPTFDKTMQVVMAPEDWLVICVGFEDRAVGVLQNAVSGQTSFNVLLVRYEPFFEENRIDDIHSICQLGRINVVEVTYNREEPSGFGSTILEQLTSCRGRIYIDVSAMSRLLIVQVLVALGTRPIGFENCFVAYAEAIDYPPSQAEAKAELAKSESDPTFSIFFLSSGIFEVTIIPELSSTAPAGVQTRLIAFPSLDAHHLTALRAEIQPSRFSFIEGVPPNPKRKWRQQMIAEVNSLDKIKEIERYQTSTLDYRETLDCLLTLYSKYSERERLLISPTGSKMQTVAVGIFRAFVQDVQIVYPTPQGFRNPNSYTSGIGPLHILPLANFTSFRTLKIGQADSEDLRGCSTHLFKACPELG